MAAEFYAGNLGYGPNPLLQQRIRDADLILAVGPRLGEATTDGYTLITPDHPGQTLVHVHPDPNELGRVYHADLPICADMGEFAEMVDEWNDPDLVRFSAGEEAHREWLEWSDPKPRDGVALDLGPCVGAMRDRLPKNTIICNGAGNFSGWWHRYWRYGPMPSQLAPTSGTMGYGVPAAVAAALRFKDRPVVALAGDGDFLMNGQELATAAQHGADILIILVDNGSYGTIRMHQERDYPERISGTALRNPDFAALARAFGGWAATVEKTEEFTPALDEALGKRRPPDPLQDRRRADHQRDDDLETAGEGEELASRVIEQEAIDARRRHSFQLAITLLPGLAFRFVVRKMLGQLVEMAAEAAFRTGTPVRHSIASGKATSGRAETLRNSTPIRWV